MSVDFSEERNMARPVTSFVVEVIVIITAAVFLVYGFGKGVINTGQSMNPTLESGDTVLVNRFIYHFKAPERYDLIAFDLENKESPDAAPETVVRRIVGLPGERIRIHGGHIYINDGQLKDDSGWNNVQLGGIAEDEIILDDDEYFVLGDNRQSSEDSRYEKVGNVKYDTITGKVWIRSAPFNKLTMLE